MKTKSKHAIPRKRKELRFKKIIFKKGGRIYKIRHPSYIIIEKGNVYVYVSITHSKHINGKILIKLRRNPNPNDKRDAYYVAEIREDSKDKFGKRLLDWSIDENDDIEIRKLNKKR